MTQTEDFLKFENETALPSPSFSQVLDLYMDAWFLNFETNRAETAHAYAKTPNFESHSSLQQIPKLGNTLCFFFFGP